MQDIENDLIHC